MALELRSYSPNDLGAMHALDVLCFEKPFRFTRAAMRQFAEAKKALVVVADDGGALSGFVILHVERSEEGRVGYVVTLDVDPALRRSGIGRMLMDEVERQAREDNCAALVLHVSAGNEAAIQFYEHVGFTRTQGVAKFYGKGADAWVYRKRIAG